MSSAPLTELLDRCLVARAVLFDPLHESAFRLFNGFTEGLPALTVDIYASTAILTNYADPPEAGENPVVSALLFLQERLPWIRTGILKTRNSKLPEEKRGKIVFGALPAQKVREHGVWYAVNPVMHQDAGLYLDTRK